ncbi:uncharacterized protein EV422DRAFT_509811 [Fimicolochytrium jonesii]|uniref:uncharacterized protein n=1 Tax=Fimicolochytrium jonesii TaxID=1396493 RepID=UPI0022FE4E1E|nr:uncharacterized protein EV422DRAFT_509811 [Fimicolochytrium jonesii]KAI8816392.1 hypothetical protein EV422DRAFT_509811 [Fimicolochytrium jonesii]
MVSLSLPAPLAALWSFRPIFNILGYLLLLGTCLLITFSRSLGALPYTKAAWIYTPIAITALYITWSDIFRFLHDDYVDFTDRSGPYASIPANGRNDIEAYLQVSDWFDAAYAAVAEDPSRWWFSSQLLNTASVIVALVWAEGAHHWAKSSVRKGGPAFFAGMASAMAYVLTGLLGAMSVAFALFLVQRRVAEKNLALRSYPRVTITIFILLAVFVAGVTYTPYALTSNYTIFSWTLIIIHGALLLPILGGAGPGLIYHPRAPRAKKTGITTSSTSPKAMSALYLFLAISNLASHAVASRNLDWHRAIGIDLADAIASHPCQKSITADLVFCTLTASFFIVAELVTAVRRGVVRAWVAVIVGTVVLAVTVFPLGVSVTLPAFLAWRETKLRQGLLEPSVVVVEEASRVKKRA